MEQSQFDSWYWGYLAEAKQAGHTPYPQLSQHVQDAYCQWAASGTPTPAEAVKWIHDGTS